jgi:hypothetical protein
MQKNRLSFTSENLHLRHRGGTGKWTFRFFFLTLLFSCFIRAEVNSDKLKEVSQSLYWRKLMHAHHRFLGGYKSEADGASFFLSVNGKTDLLEELKASIEAFDPNSKLKIGTMAQHPQCAFPERFRFLNNELNLKIPKIQCEDFEKWKKQLNAQSVTLVFSSSYLNNPASMFGHTFLRIDSAPYVQGARKNDLLDYGINYAAKTGDDGGLFFAVNGLIGKYDGYFSLMPYFDKVKEYNDVESRDLWEYPIHLNAEQIDRMLNHLWELGTTTFDYYFFDENCSYHLLSLLEVANPEWNLTEPFFYWVIPSDTIKLLKKIPGALGEPKFRPSLYRHFLKKFQEMSDEEKKTFWKIWNEYKEKKVLNGDETALQLDALIEFLNYNRMKERRNLTEEEKVQEREIRVARSKKESKRIEVNEIQSSSRPDLGVDSFKVSARAGRFQNHSFTGIEIRPVFHDLMDIDLGYQSYSEINLLRAQFRYYFDKKKFKLNEWQWAEVVSMNPQSSISRGMSWAVQAGIVTPQDLECHFCNVGKVSGGMGWSRYLIPRYENGLIFAMLKANLEYSGHFDFVLRAGPSLWTGIFLVAKDHLKFSVQSEFFYFPTQDVGRRSALKVLSPVSLQLYKNTEIRIIPSIIWANSRNSKHDGEVAMSFFF